MAASADTAGSYSLFGVQPSGYTDVSAGSTVTVGPFDVDKIYEVDNLSFSYVPYIVQNVDDVSVKIVNTVNVGVAADGVTAEEHGNGYQNTTKLTVNTILPAIAGGADLSVGALLYTLPAGAVVVDVSYMNVAVTQTEGNITTDTPDVGLGTVIASGVHALLSDTTGAENLLTGQTATDCSGTSTVKTVADQRLVIESGDDHTVYFNAAAAWSASGDAAAIVSGTVVLNWQFIE